MFYKMIKNKCDEWFNSDDCTVNTLIDYITETGRMRDAQIEAIKTYLFLKIKCGNKPLAELFIQGAFNGLDLNKVPLAVDTRQYLEDNPAVAALFEYSKLVDDSGNQVSEALEKVLAKSPHTIDSDRVIRDFFYNVKYTDYLFSLPMGAGKTFLMAAFIYLDLYFAVNEPHNPVFSHNFIIFAPSGTKSSIVPSLKTIQRFDPAWVLPEPAASDIRRLISFEILDEAKSSTKSNKTKNPNVQKIANHQPLNALFGLVAVTNAEKVILDRIDERNGQITWFEDSAGEKDRQANELRNLIGKIPHLSIIIDEVHHASSQAEKKGERKLRSVVNRWADNGGVTTVLGFSGTPYLSSAEKYNIGDKLKLANTEITNVVFYYPLIEGIGNFLKRPIVKIADISDSTVIVEQGVRTFLNEYLNTYYEGGLTAKLGVYCGTIEKCEEVVYPMVLRIAAEYGLGTESVLRYHGGNKTYPQPADSALQFASLDRPFSNVRIVLLVQIGKEGWDCQSLTGIILSQEGDCPTNMVLQTSCRCLRQVGNTIPATALIYLNKSNGEKLEKQLNEQHHISVKEFESGETTKTLIKRYDRTKHLRLPDVEFYQLKVQYEDLIVEKANPQKALSFAHKNANKRQQSIRTTDFNFDEVHESIETYYGRKDDYSITFHKWLFDISKEGFGTPAYEELLKYKELQEIFNEITIEYGDCRYFDPEIDVWKVNANVRKAFKDLKDFRTTEELIPSKSRLLRIENLKSEMLVNDPASYYPNQKLTEAIVKEDKNGPKQDKKRDEVIRQLRELGQTEMAEHLAVSAEAHPNKDRSFHYIPYRTDSSFEQTFLEKALLYQDLKDLGLEIYYNGDRSMTDFKIKCYKRQNNSWNYIGMYTPDFLIIERKDDKIYKAVIVETKGNIYANDPLFKDKKAFMETEFGKHNNKAFGYERFDYLYLEDTMPEEDRLELTHRKVKEFFGEEN